MIMSKSKVYNFCASNYKKYNLGLKSEKDMVALLNMLEAHGETLDCLHDCDEYEFCDIYVKSFDDSSLANAVLGCNAFYDNWNEYILNVVLYDSSSIEEAKEFMVFDLFNSDVVFTTDGVVEKNIV